MTDIRGRLNSFKDRETWAARGISFVAKVKATKAVWFPPKPVETGKKAASAAKRTTKRAAKKTTGAAKKAPAAAKTARAGKKVISPARGKKT